MATALGHTESFMQDPFDAQITSAMEEKSEEDRTYLLALMAQGLLRDKIAFPHSQPNGQRFKGMRGSHAEIRAEMFYTPGQTGHPETFYTDPQSFPGNWGGNIEPDIWWGETPNYLVTGVDQNRLCRFNINENLPTTLAIANITSCSLFVAKSEKNLWVAHVGMSETGQFEGIVNYLRRNDPKSLINAIAMINTGKVSEELQHKSDNFDFRQITKARLIELGIDPNNIYGHNYYVQQPTEEEIEKLEIPKQQTDFYWMRRNVAGFLISQSRVIRGCWDENTNRKLEGKVGQLKDESLLEISI